MIISWVCFVRKKRAYLEFSAHDVEGGPGGGERSLAGQHAHVGQPAERGGQLVAHGVRAGVHVQHVEVPAPVDLAQKLQLRGAVS